MSSNSQVPVRPVRARFLSATAVVAVAVALAAAGCSSSGSSSAGSASLKPLRVGTSSAAVSTASASYSVGEYLGCYKAAGYKLSVTGDSSASGLIAAMQRGDTDIGVAGSDQYLGMVQTIATGGNGLPLTAIYEVANPFHWALAVKPGSDITSFQQLVGKTVGLDSLASSGGNILKTLLTNYGITPSSVKTIVSGQGAASGQALESGKVDAIFTSDTTFGTIIQAGVQMRFVTVDGKPPYLPVTGVLAMTPQKTYQSDPAMAKVFAKCTAEGNVFVSTNPDAAAYIMLKMFPVLGSPGKPLADQIAPLALQITIRNKTINNIDTTVKPGTMSLQELQDTVKYLLPAGTSIDVAKYFTNDAITPLTDAEIAAVKKQAQDFKIPGISGPVTLPTIPDNAP
jgi:NitT/TauT family transport system substrate-binding protein